MVQENKMKYIALLLMILALSGCSFKEVKPTNYYTLELNSKPLTYSKSQKSIYIAPPKINAPYDSKNIFFTQKPYVFESYAVNKWLELPSLQTQSAWYDAFKQSSLFEHVALQKNTNSDLILKSHISKLYHVYENNQSFAWIELFVELFQNDQRLKIFHFSQKVLCDENSPYGFVKASNKAFESITFELLNHLSQTI
mgnify:CR=1 FL=1